MGKADGKTKLVQVFGWEEQESSEVFWNSNRDSCSSVKQFTLSHLPCDVNHSSCMHVLHSAPMQCSIYRDFELSSLRFYCENIPPDHVADESQSPGCAPVKSKRWGEGGLHSRSSVCILAPHWSLLEGNCFKVHFHQMLLRAHQRTIWCPWRNVTIEPIILIPITKDLFGMQPHQSILFYFEIVLLQFN